MPQLLVKPLSWFKVNPQARKSFDEAELRPLGESLKVKQLQPVLTQPDGIIIAGERRYRAALLVGLPTLEVKIADEQLDPIQMKAWQFVENELRQDLKPHEKVNAVAEFAALKPEWTGKEIAENLHISAVDVSKFLTIVRCPVAHSALAEGRIGLTDAYAIAKAAPEAKSGLLALRMGGATRDETARKARSAKPTPSEKPEPAKTKRISIPLPKANATVSVTADVASVDGLIGVLTEALELARKSLRENHSLTTATRAWADRAKAGKS